MKYKAFWVVEDGRLAEYSRRGSCNKCGLCCCKNKIKVRMRAHIGGDDSDNTDDYSDWEGWSCHEDRGVEWWWKLDVTNEMLDKKCESLTENRCERWNDDIPVVCQYFPMQPSDIEKFPECGFSFVREMDEGRAEDAAA